MYFIEDLWPDFCGESLAGRPLHGPNSETDEAHVDKDPISRAPRVRAPKPLSCAIAPMRHSLARLAASVATLFAVVTIAFFLMHLAPGGPFDTERGIDPLTLQHLKALYGLDLPLPQQFGRYLLGLLHGDLGPSLRWRDFTVAEIFARALPVSLILGTEALIVALFGGVALGLVAAVRRHGLAARGVGVFALARDRCAELRHRAAFAARLRPHAQKPAGRRLE